MYGRYGSRAGVKMMPSLPWLSLRSGSLYAYRMFEPGGATFTWEKMLGSNFIAKKSLSSTAKCSPAKAAGSLSESA